jgi:hypothetical protein
MPSSVPPRRGDAVTRNTVPFGIDSDSVALYEMHTDDEGK